MESFGRTIALSVSIMGVAFLLLFSKTGPVRWQRHETLRSMSRAYAKKIMHDKKIAFNEWEAFLKEINRFGGYRAELTVYEKRRFEDDNGGFYLYQRSDIAGDKVLKEGSYVRIVVIPMNGEDRETFLFGDYATIVAGGCVQ